MEAWQYIALLGAVIAVTAVILPKGKPLKTDSVHSGDSIEHMELAFEQFMENMEKDHQELVKMLTASLQTLREENRIKSEKMISMEKKVVEFEEQLSSLSHAHTATVTKLDILQKQSYRSTAEVGANSLYQSELLQDEKKTLETIKNENSIQYRYAQIFEMYEAGKSIEAIAKKLGKNKGEVQLILQLAKQEEHIKHE